MWGIFSRRSTVDNAPSGTFSQPNGITDHGVPSKTNNNLTRPQLGAVMDKQVRESFSFPEMNNVNNMNNNALTSNQNDVNDGIPRLSRSLSHKSRSTKSRPAAVTKVSEVSSLFGRAGTGGFGKAVEVLDTLGSSGLFLGATTKGIKISILSFEVANTVVMGANLMLSLSKENIKHLKEVVLPSEGVQYLVSKNMDELLRIAAADKREELKIFSREVVRFGNRCKDHQWHNLDRYFDDMDRHFEKLGSGFVIKKQLKEEVETMMHQLITMVQYTAELYHELHALDRFEQDYQRKLQEEDNSNAAQRGDSLAILRAEIKSQRKYVRNLKKKSLWSMVLEEAMKRLVDIVQFLHLQFHAVFGKADSNKPKVSLYHQKLGPAGLALHYANIITQIVEIDTLVSRSSSIPPNTRDALYQGLPPTVKSVLRSKLQLFQLKEELTVPQIKAEMEKTLQWLVPIATNTTNAHYSFGWGGEWANTGKWFQQTGQTDLIRIETLHHADKEKTEVCILDLVVWLHHLVSQSRSGPNGGIRSPIKSPIRSPNQNVPLPSHKPYGSSPILTVEDQEMLRAVNERKLTPGISKSQEFDTLKDRSGRLNRLSKSNSHSPTTNKEFFPLRRPPTLPLIDFDIDVIDIDFFLH